MDLTIIPNDHDRIKERMLDTVMNDVGGVLYRYMGQIMPFVPDMINYYHYKFSVDWLFYERSTFETQALVQQIEEVEP